MPNASRRADALAVAWALLVFVFAAWVRPHMMPNLINDEAVELLQAKDLPHDHWYYFVPSYQGGRTDIIESLPSYLNRAVWRWFGFGIRPLLVLHAAALALAVWAFYRGARRLFGPGWGVAAAFVFGGSSYLVFFDQVLTRNAFTPLWSALVFALGAAIVAPNATARGTAFRLAALFAVFFLALMSYTSFKLLLVPVYGTLTVALWRAGRRPLALFAAASVLGVLALTAGAVVAGGMPLHHLLERGSYAMVDAGAGAGARYARHLWHTALLPAWRDPGYRDFVVEETNAGYDRAMLPWVAGPLFGLGVLLALTRRSRVSGALWLVAPFLAAVPLLALGGPNLKHCLVVFPWVAALVAVGARFVYGALHPRGGSLAATAVLALLGACFLYAEARHLLHTIPGNDFLVSMNGRGAATARVLIAHSEGHRRAYMIGTAGIDIDRFWLRTDADGKGTLPLELDWISEIDEGVARQLRKQTDAMIVWQGEQIPEYARANPAFALCFDHKVEGAREFANSIWLRKPACDWGAPADDEDD